MIDIPVPTALSLPVADPAGGAFENLHVYIAEYGDRVEPETSWLMSIKVPSRGAQILAGLTLHATPPRRTPRS